MGAHRVVGRVDGVRLGRHGQVHHHLREREFALGGAQSLVGFGAIERQAQGARVGQANIFAGHAHQAAR